MAGQQTFGRQGDIFHIKGVGTTHQFDMQLLRRTFYFPERNTSASGRGVFIGDSQFFEGENIMKQHDLPLEAFRLNGGRQVVPARIFGGRDNAGFHGVGHGRDDNRDGQVGGGKILTCPGAEGENHVHIAFSLIRVSESCVVCVRLPASQPAE